MESNDSQISNITVKVKKRGRIAPFSRWILITGCDSGFGYMSAIKLLSEGFGVIGACLTEKGCEKLDKATNNHPDLIAVHCDITKSEMVENLKSVIYNLPHGRFWAIVNNAGIALPGNMDFLSVTDYRRVMEVNYFSAINLTHLCLPLLKEARGRIVFMSSTCGFVAMSGNSPYNASKFALEGLADTIRRELSIWDIKVSVIQPSTMRTAVSTGFYSIAEDRFKNAPLEIQHCYGEEFVSDYLPAQQAQMNRLLEDPQLVVDDVRDAVMSKRPKKRYRPGFAAKIIFKPISKMPSAWADKILSAVTKPYIPKTFNQRGSLIFEFTHYYPTDVKETWSLWFDFLWKRGAGSRKLPKIQEPGDETGKGFQRFISTFGDSGLIEKVIDTDYPKKIIYKVMNPSKMTFPSLYHRGTVYFVPLRSKGTVIHWMVEVQPMPGSKMIISLLTRGVISTYLKKLAKHVQKIKSTPSGQQPAAIISGNL